MATGQEWERYFRSLPAARRKSLDKAIATLMNDPMISKEFKWTGIGALRNMLR